MCMNIIGPMVILPETSAWKVTMKGSFTQGIYYNTTFQEDGWSIPAKPKTSICPNYKISQRGYHVFTTKLSAERYYIDYNEEQIVEVLIQGRAFPFRSGDLKGFVVEQWKPVRVVT